MYVHMMGYQSSLKWKEILATWMNPADMMLNDNQSQKDKILYDFNYMIYLEWSDSKREKVEW